MTNILKNDQSYQLYLASLELGDTTILKLSRKTKIPRSTCYLLIKDLIKQGLITNHEQGKKKYFKAENPEKIKNIIAVEKARILKQEEIIINELPLLQALYQDKLFKPTITFYQGVVKFEILLKKLKPGSKIFIISSTHQTEIRNQSKIHFKKIFLKKCTEESITVKEIIPMNKKSHRQSCQLDQKNSSSQHEIRITNYVGMQNCLEKIIFQDFIAFIDYDRENMTLIEDKNISNFEKKLFWEYWQNLT